jgi:serine protease Do
MKSMNKNIKDKLRNKEKFMDESFPSIQFKRKKIKSNIKIGSKIICLFIIAGLSGVFFSNLIIEKKYKDMSNKINKNIENGASSIDYSRLAEKLKKSLVTISDSKEHLTENLYFDNNSTGIIIDNDGKILTNYSKVKDLRQIYVKLSSIDSEPISAEFIVGNEELDMAIIQVNYSDELVPIKFASKSEKFEGQKIALISNSVGDDYIDNIIPGIITSTNRNLKIKNNTYELLELNTPITPINTGGIISNLDGELIGIASYKITSDMKQNGLYYAVDVSSLEEIINSTNEVKDILGVLEGGFINGKDRFTVVGFYVARIKRDSNSYKSGLRPTDIIFNIDGNEITSINQVSKILKNKKDGDTLNCKVMRDGEVRNLQIKLDSISQ